MIRSPPLLIHRHASGILLEPVPLPVLGARSCSLGACDAGGDPVHRIPANVRVAHDIVGIINMVNLVDVGDSAPRLRMLTLMHARCALRRAVYTARGGRSHATQSADGTGGYCIAIRTSM